MKRLWAWRPDLVTVACITFVSGLIMLGVLAWTGGSACG